MGLQRTRTGIHANDIVNALMHALNKGWEPMFSLGRELHEFFCMDGKADIEWLFRLSKSRKDYEDGTLADLNI